MSAELVIHGNHCGSTPNVAQSVNFSSSAFPSNITTVAQALDYCFENKVKVTTLSQAEYNALPTDQKNKGVYVINDAPSLTAATLIYDGEDTGLGSNVQDAIDTLSDNLTSLEANTFGESVNLLSYGEGNLYTFPRDGYVYINSSNGTIFFKLYDRLDNLLDCAALTVSGSTYQRTSIFVKKGMKGYGARNTSSGIANYIPLI